MVRLLEPPFVVRVPGLDTVVETRFHLWPERSEPRGITADPPVAVRLHDSAELSVGRGVEIVNLWANWERSAEGLVAPLVLRHAELGLAERALERREEMRDGLRVVPHMGT